MVIDFDRYRDPASAGGAGSGRGPARLTGRRPDAPRPEAQGQTALRAGVGARAWQSLMTEPHHLTEGQLLTVIGLCLVVLVLLVASVYIGNYEQFGA